MKLIITESQAQFLFEDWKSGVKNYAGEKLNSLSQWGAEKAANIVTDVGPDVANWAIKQQTGGESPTELSPEIAARFNDIDIEKTAPNLSKFMSSIKNPTAATGAGDVFKNLELSIKPGEMLHPLGRKVKISSLFGNRNIKGEPKATKFHRAVDFDARSGSPIYAPLDGVVVRAEDTSPNGCGGHVRLNHSKEMDTKYCHLRSWKVKKGDKVKKGQIIGYTGGGENDPYQGVSTGPHLHYEIVVNGTSVDPLKVQTNLA